MTRRVRLEGSITASGFASGDRIVAGVWTSGPLGPMVDVMWARPNGSKILIAPSSEVADFVAGVYDFDSIEVAAIAVRRSRAELQLRAGSLELQATAGRRHPLFGLRPRFLRRSPAWVRVEDVVLRPLVGRYALGGARGVRAYGRTPGGVREWYCVDSYRPLVDARAWLDGVDLGPMSPLDPPVRFGISEFPLRPAMVECAPVLEGVDRWLPDNIHRRAETQEDR